MVSKNVGQDLAQAHPCRYFRQNKPRSSRRRPPTRHSILQTQARSRRRRPPRRLRYPLPASTPPPPLRRRRRRRRSPARRLGHDAAGAGLHTLFFLRRRPPQAPFPFPPPLAPPPLLTPSPPLPSATQLPPSPSLVPASPPLRRHFLITRIVVQSTGSAHPRAPLIADWPHPAPLGSSATSDFMGDLACDSERVLMEGHDVSSVCKDDMVLLEEALPPAGQTLGSCAELCHNQDGTHKQARDAGFFDSEVDISGSPSSGIKRGKGGDGNSRAISNYIEPKASSTYERLPSFPSTSRLLVSTMKGGRERSGCEALSTGARRVNWAPDVYDPPVTSVDHTVKGHQQRSRSRKKDKSKQKQKPKKRKSRGNGKKSGLHNATHNPPALDVPGPSSPEELGLGEVEEAEVLDYSAFDAQEPKCGGVFPCEIAAARTCFPAAEAS